MLTCQITLNACTLLLLLMLISKAHQGQHANMHYNHIKVLTMFLNVSRSIVSRLGISRQFHCMIVLGRKEYL